MSGALKLPINVLEFLTFQVALMTFWPVAHGVPAVLFSDSLASVFAVANRSARAPLMRHVSDRLRACTAFREWTTAGLWLSHTFGHGNPGADMSRGYFVQLKAFCLQIGVRPTCLEAPADAIALFDSLIAEHVSRHASALTNS